MFTPQAQIMGGFKISRARLWVGLAAAGIIIAATAADVGIGTYCAVCPVGFLQISAAARGFPLAMLPGVLIGLLLILILGKFFCGWLCPTTVVRQTFNKKQNAACGGRCYQRKGKSGYIPYIILGGVVVVSFIVQFPLFCLICPIGLFFGTMYAVFRLFNLYEPSWNLIIFPAILLAEVLLFRRWCSSICPIGAVFSLIRKIPVPGRIKFNIHRKTCLHFNGQICRRCEEACPAGIELTADKNKMQECVTCFKCRDICPTSSIMTEFTDKNVTNKE